jgi:transcriptional regulator with XRE-family HTH domain
VLGFAHQEVFLMGEKARPKPARLAEKLKEIRLRTDGGLTQVEMIKRLGFTEEELPQDRISKFERGAMEPSLIVLMAYSDAANLYLEAICRDDRDLPPGKLPSLGKHEGVKRKLTRPAKKMPAKNR